MFFTFPYYEIICLKERKGKERTWRVAKYDDPYLEFVLCI